VTARITPTGWAQQRGTPVKQLGSVEAVIEALPDAPQQVWLIVPSYRASVHAADWIISRELRKNIEFASASEGLAALYAIPKDAVVGVAPDAFTGTRAEVWADMQRILTTRFREVIWG
jgi:hypothetical protein